MINTCNDLISHKRVVVSENKRKFIIINNDLYLVNKVEVDGCYIKQGLKCDFLFEILSKENKNLEKVFYVELKGKDILHGIEQLKKTISDCKEKHDKVKEKKAFIVASRVPKANTSLQNLKVKFKKAMNIQLFIDTNQREENL